LKDPAFLQQLNDRFATSGAEDILAYALAHFGKKISFASSLGAEDQVITHMIAGIDKEARIFTLDTGRLFPESYDLIHNTNSRYGIRMEVKFPDAGKVESMVNEKGINLFYDSIENRKRCCNIRKIEPLGRALSGMEAWITGLRREQSVTRAHMEIFQWDEVNGLIKVNPLIEWSEEAVWEFIKTNKVPYNTLHDKGFPSIGCQPCTREVLPGEDVRAGRWWWEHPDTRECGLHKK
jgi:phosphoadenosine phosphosulfate reductase